MRLRGRRFRPQREYLAMIEAAGLTGVEILKDEDYLASLAKVAPEEADAMLAGWGVTARSSWARSTRSPGAR